MGIQTAVTIHDVGKMHVPADILSKPCFEPGQGLLFEHIQRRNCGNFLKKELQI
jgi:hypothetical protein